MEAEKPLRSATIRSMRAVCACGLVVDRLQLFTIITETENRRGIWHLISDKPPGHIRDAG